MALVWNSAFALLMVTGTFFGLALPLAKAATEAGISAVLWSFVIACGAGGVLFVALLAGAGSFAPTWRKLRYYLTAAAISYAFPNFLMFSAVPHLGAGYTSIMVTLSPIFTLLFSRVLGLRRISRLGIAGIGVGFLGAATVALTRGEAGQPADPFWIAVGLFVPVCLASGNVYRTMAWPKDAGPIELAAGCNLAAALILLIGLLARGETSAIADLADVPLLTLAQIGAAAAMFAFYFRLQAVGGPVYLSQIGYVGAAVGLAGGVAFLGERYELLTWFGAAVVVLGVAMTTRAQKAAV